MSPPTRTYRVYCYDAAHRAVTSDFVEAASDEEAIAKVEAAGFGLKCEIWEGKRLVAALAERRTA